MITTVSATTWASFCTMAPLGMMMGHVGSTLVVQLPAYEPPPPRGPAEARPAPSDIGVGADVGQLQERVAALEQEMERLRRVFVAHQRAVWAEFDQPSGCFTGNMRLLRRDGTALSFNDMARLVASSQSLPEVASFDEAAAQIVYQQPTRLVQHQAMQSALLMLALRGVTNPLAVTPEHHLLMFLGSGRQWREAATLQRQGGALINPFEPIPSRAYVYDHDRFFRQEGEFDLFDLSFDSETTGMFPTYLVSPDGLHWFVAHNKD